MAHDSDSATVVRLDTTMTIKTMKTVAKVLASRFGGHAVEYSGVAMAIIRDLDAQAMVVARRAMIAAEEGQE